MKSILAVIGVFLILVVAFWGSIAYVAVHFIQKFW